MYCGHEIGKHGIKKEQKKIEAVEKLPRPTNISEIWVFLGLINYYGRFIENLIDILGPLNALLRKNAQFKWTRECEMLSKAQSKHFVVIISYN